jgi:hypothetical protein
MYSGNMHAVRGKNVQPHTSAWVSFTYASFAASAFMVGVGVFFLPLDPWIKSHLAIAS